jgi:hypothetical protein
VTNLAAAAVGLLLACFGMCPAGHSQSWRSQMANLQHLSTHLRSFQSSRSLQSLRQALADLEGIDLHQADEGTHEQIMNGWTALFGAIDQATDSTFAPTDVPELNLVPPTAGGVTYPSGVDPAAIADPDARASYEADLERNRQKAERYHFQYGLLPIANRAGLSFGSYAAHVGANAPAMKERLHPLIRNSALRDETKQHLLTIIEGR